MLVLTRRRDEVIRIGTDIRVRVVRIEGGKVRLAIDAPRSIAIERDELECNVKSLASHSAAAA